MGLADVFRLTFAALAVIKAIDAIDAGGWAVAVWVTACIAAGLSRWGYLALSLVAVVGWATVPDLASNHTILIFWVGLILSIVPPGHRDRLLWIQTIVLYAFAAAAKINPVYLAGGGALENHLGSLPAEMRVVLAVGAVIGEGWLAWAVWRRHRWALPVAALLHLGIVAMMAHWEPYRLVLLGSFNGMLVMLVWVTTRHPAMLQHQER